MNPDDRRYPRRVKCDTTFVCPHSVFTNPYFAVEPSKERLPPSIKALEHACAQALIYYFEQDKNIQTAQWAWRHEKSPVDGDVFVRFKGDQQHYVRMPTEIKSHLSPHWSRRPNSLWGEYGNKQWQELNSSPDAIIAHCGWRQSQANQWDLLVALSFYPFVT